MTTQTDNLDIKDTGSREKTDQALRILSDSDLVSKYYDQLRADCVSRTLSPIMTKNDLINYIGFEPDLKKLFDAVFDLDPKALGISTDTEAPNFEDPDPDNFVKLNVKYYGADGKERSPLTKYLPKHVYDAYTAMNQAYTQFLNQTRGNMALPARPGLVVESGYRSPTYQAVIALRTIHERGLDETLRSLMPPGYSQHGRIKECAIDIVKIGDDYGHIIHSDGKPISMDETMEGVWLLANADRFGFWMPFHPDPENPIGDRGDTGIIVEPWHWQFVGVPKASELMIKHAVRDIYSTRHQLLGVKSTPTA